MNRINKGVMYEKYINNYLNSIKNNKAWLWSDIPLEHLNKAGIIGEWNRHLMIKKSNKINNLPDLGVDILLKRKNEYVFVQCKNYEESNSITMDKLSSFFYSVIVYNKNGIVYYTSKLSSNFKLFDKPKQIEFIKKTF